MLADPILTAIGSWLATYWVHAGVAVLATWLLVRTLLRGGSSELRAAAWRAALVAPLVTTTLRHFVFEHSAAIEVTWLDAGRHVSLLEGATDVATGEHPPASITAVGTGAATRGVVPIAGGGARDRSTGRLRTPAPELERSGSPVADDTASESGALRLAVRREASPEPRMVATNATEEVLPSLATGGAAGSMGPAALEPHTSGTPSGLSSFVAAIDARRLALLLAACVALLAVARWFDGWWRLNHRLAQRGALPQPLADRAAHLAREMGVPTVRITQSARICVPMAFGFVRREVCLPLDFHEELSEDEWNAAVAHELAHHVRGDGRWLPVLRLLSRLLAFQPLNLLAWREVQRESEHAADEEAVRFTGAAEALALCLAKVAARIHTRHGQLPAAAMTGAPTMAARPALVVERAERLVASLDHDASRPRRATRFAALLPTALIAAFGPHLAPLLAADSAGRMQESVDAPHVGSRGNAATPRTDLPTSTPVAAPEAVPSTTPIAATDELLAAARELEAELVLARNEIEQSLDDANDEQRAGLLSMLERLTTLEQRTSVLEHLFHGRGARAKAPPSTTSPDHDTTPVTTR